MKWVSVVTTAVLAVSMSVHAQVEKPRVLDEAMISISIPNVHGFLDQFGLVAAQASPMMNGAMIKSMIGMQLGDMNLAGIPANGGLSIVALDPTNIFAVVEVSEATSSAYLNMAKAKGLQAEYADGAVILAKDAGALAKGAAESATVKAQLLANNGAVLSIAMQPSSMIERNRESIDGFMQMMPAMLGMSMMQQPGATLDSTQSITKLLQAELLVLVSLSEQCSEAEIKLAPAGGSLVMSKTFVPKVGTPLANLVQAPALAVENKKLHSGILGDGAVKIDFVFSNPGAFSEFVAVETEKAVKAMQLEEVDAEAIAKLMTKCIDVYSGTGCEVVSFDEGKIGVRYVMEVADEAKAFEVLRTMDTDMQPFFKMYESMGMPMSMEFKENVREADGVKIHQFSMKTDISAMPDEQKEQMAAMGVDEMVYDLAITDGLMFYSEAGGMEALLKKVKSGADAPKIAARSTYPAGGFYYFDLDVGQYMGFVAQAMPDTPSSAMMKQQMGTLFAGATPVTSAGFKKDGMVHWSLTIPGDLIAKYGQMIMMQQMQNMQQSQMMAPPAMP